MAPPARRRGLTPSETVRKLLAYTAAMFLAPFAAYRVSQSPLLPAAHARYGWRAIEDEGGRAVWSGVAWQQTLDASLGVERGLRAVDRLLERYPTGAPPPRR